jgi:hypothetical protein
LWACKIFVIRHSIRGFGIAALDLIQDAAEEKNVWALCPIISNQPTFRVPTLVGQICVLHGGLRETRLGLVPGVFFKHLTFACLGFRWTPFF